MTPNSYKNWTLVILVWLNYKILFVLWIKALVETVIFFHFFFLSSLKKEHLKSQTYILFLIAHLKF